MDLRIEKICESDFEELINLFQEFAIFEKLPHKMVNTVEKMREEMEYFNGFTVKDEHNNILGYVTFFFAYYTWIGKSLYMDDLYVCPPHRGKGLGKMLINEVISFAQKNKCHKLRWQVSNWNESAIKFYHSLGAQIDDVEKNCDLTLNPIVAIRSNELKNER